MPKTVQKKTLLTNEDRKARIARQKRRKSAIRDKFLKRMPTGGLCVEIGVWRGEFSSEILSVIKPDCLVLVDPWRSFDEHDDQSFSGREGDIKMERIYKKVIADYAEEIATGQIKVIRDVSTVALGGFEDESISFAYVDGDHSYEGVKADIDKLFPKMSVGGVIAFDDYHRRGWWKDGVLRAIHEFLGAHPREVRILAVEGAQIAFEKIEPPTDG